jgi:hypothetical protein
MEVTFTLMPPMKLVRSDSHGEVTTTSNRVFACALSGPIPQKHK